MNHVTAAGAASVEFTWLPGVMTALFIVFFAGWALSLYRKRNAPIFDAAARLPLED